ncbi:unnamed protein product, partial [Effrenium voratum]
DLLQGQVSDGSAGGWRARGLQREGERVPLRRGRHRGLSEAHALLGRAGGT